jgi:hypothetical protein
MGELRNEDKIGDLFLGFLCLPVLEKGLENGSGCTGIDEITRMTSQIREEEWNHFNMMIPSIQLKQ